MVRESREEVHSVWRIMQLCRCHSNYEFLVWKECPSRSSPFFAIGRLYILMTRNGLQLFLLIGFGALSIAAHRGLAIKLEGFVGEKSSNIGVGSCSSQFSILEYRQDYNKFVRMMVYFLPKCRCLSCELFNEDYDTNRCCMDEWGKFLSRFENLQFLSYTIYPNVCIKICLTAITASCCFYSIILTTSNEIAPDAFRRKSNWKLRERDLPKFLQSVSFKQPSAGLSLLMMIAELLLWFRYL